MSEQVYDPCANSWPVTGREMAEMRRMNLTASRRWDPVARTWVTTFDPPPPDVVKMGAALAEFFDVVRYAIATVPLHEHDRIVAELRAKADRGRWSIETRLRETREKVAALLEDLNR